MKRAVKPAARLLAVDVGNTNVTVGLFRGCRLAAAGKIPTGRLLRGGGGAEWVLRAWLRRVGRRIPGPPQAAVFSSVVPRAVAPLGRALRRVLGVRPEVVGRTLQAPVKNCYRIPSQVGQDRLVNAAAAAFLYGGPAIVVDFGTAVTVDLVSARKEYLGGLIVPGMELALEALTSRAALLPRVAFRAPCQFLGRTTVQSVRSGIFHGYAALCDGLVERLQSDPRARKAKVVATGGNAPLLAPYCRSIGLVNTALTLEGLRITYDTKKGLDNPV